MTSETTSETTSEIFIARQPILDAERTTFGYELLYRDGAGRPAQLDPDRATQTVIGRAFLDWGMERLIGDRFGFINADPSLIERGIHRALPPEGIIFELADHERIRPSAVDAIVAARREGYHFALDDTTSLRRLVASPLMPHVSMVKIDVSRTPAAELGAIVDHLRSRHPGVLLIAEKVERRDAFATAAELGCDLFQGYFFAEPQILSKSARPANAATAIALLGEIQRDDADPDRIEQLIGSDPSLAYRVLATVNSSAFGLDRRVESLKHAIVLLGLNQVRHLATLLTLTAASDGDEELITLGATRARLASSLMADRALRSSAYTVGLLSVTDALFHAPLRDLIDDLPVSEQISAALLHGAGELGAALAVVQACERADVGELERLAPGRLDEVREAYLDATRWADTLRRQLTGGGFLVDGPTVSTTIEMSRDQLVRRRSRPAPAATPG